MKELRYENISTFLDGELSEKELDRLINDMANDSSMNEHLIKYQRISDLMQSGEVDRKVDASDIATRVSDFLKDEPTILAPQKRSFTDLPKIVLGAALAATVAAVAVGVAPHLLAPQEPAFSEAASFAFSPKFATPNFKISTVALRNSSDELKSTAPVNAQQKWKVLRPKTQHRLDRYLLEHNEYSGRSAVNGPNAHVGFVSIKGASNN